MKPQKSALRRWHILERTDMLTEVKQSQLAVGQNCGSQRTRKFWIMIIPPIDGVL